MDFGTLLLIIVVPLFLGYLFLVRIAGWASVKSMPFREMEDTAHRAPVNVDDYLT